MFKYFNICFTLTNKRRNY